MSDVIHRELPLATIQTTEETTVITEGVADLVFREGEQWILVDYKSDSDIPPDRLATYNAQLHQYISMLNAAGIEIAEAYILRTATGEALQVEIET